MKQFQFRLQKVMETTRTREEVQKRELADAFRRLEASERMLEEMITNLESQIAEFGQSLHGKGS